MNQSTRENQGLTPTPRGTEVHLGRRPGAAVPSALLRPERGSSLLLDYVGTMGRYRWLIIGAGLLGLLGGLIVNLPTLPVYQARTSIDVQTLNGDFMNMHSVAPMSDQSAASGDALVQTQIKLLESETLLDDTAARLEAENHPASVERDDLISQWKRRVHLSRLEPIAYNDLVEYAAQHVKVKPLGLTRLIEITCDSWDAGFSAKFCNTLTTTFQTEDQEARAAEAKKTSEWLARQAEDVRVKAEDSQKRLELAVGGNGLMLSQDTNTVGEDRLRDLQQELIRAQADRMEKEAQSAIASSSAADTVPGVVDRAGYQNYQLKLAELRAELAKLVPPLTEDNPKVIHVQSEIKQAEAGLNRERESDTARIRNDYDASRHREALLRATYEATATNVSTDLKKALRVRLLRSEVDSEQQLYQTLLQRAKEAGFASAMHASTLHVVDAARAPSLPIGPRRGSSAVLGMLLGSLAGVGFAFLKDRHSDILRVPGDTSRLLNLHELGVIPSNVEVRNSLSSAVQGWSSGARGRERADEGPRDALSMAKWNDDFSIVAEAYRSATLSILLSEVASRDSRTYVIASPSASDGKTSITSNLGVALSKSKLRVLLIDGDLRRPTLHAALGVSNQFGLRDLLKSEVPLGEIPESGMVVPTRVPNLWVLPSGSGREQVLDLLHTSRVRDLIQHLAQSFDVILIDTPPMLHMSDARLLAGHADGVILVVRSGVTMRDDAANALQLFERDGVHVIGTILNDFDPSKQGHSGYYKSYYAYKDENDAAAVRGK